MLSYTAIVLHHWTQRAEYFSKILDALKQSSIPPKEIIVWNNAGSIGEVFATVVHASRNFGCGARFAAAFLAQTPYILFQDDDLVVQRRTVENLAKGDCDHSVVGLDGRILTGKGYQEAKVVSGYAISCCTDVDICIGRITLWSRNTLVRCLAEMPPFTLDDDIWASWSANLRGKEVVVMPCNNEDETGWTNLDEHGVGLCHQREHYVRRTDLCTKLFGGKYEGSIT